MDFTEQLARLMFLQQYPQKSWEQLGSGPLTLRTIYLRRAESVIAFFGQSGWTNAEDKAIAILDFLTSEAVNGNSR
jgi:hypothetical protein